MYVKVRKKLIKHLTEVLTTRDVAYLILALELDIVSKCSYSYSRLYVCSKWSSKVKHTAREQL